MDRPSLSDPPSPVPGPISSPASPASRAPRAPPNLPFELWAQILDLSAPPPSFDAWPARAAALRTLAQISRAFGAIAQGLLLRHPVLPRQANLRLLLRTLEEHGEGNGDEADAALWRRSGVRSVRLGCREMSWGDASGEVGRLLALCGRLEEVRLYQVGQIEVAQLTHGQALRRLFVVKTTLRHSALLAEPLCLPRLEHLHLHLALASVDPGVDRGLLTAEALPNLTALARFGLGTSASEARLVARLTSLSLSKPPPPDLACPTLRLWDSQSPLAAPTPTPTDAAAADANATSAFPPPLPAVFAPPSVSVVRFSRPSLDLAAAPAYLAHFPLLVEVHVRDVAPPTGAGLAALQAWCAGRSGSGGAARLVIEAGGEGYVEGFFNSPFWRLVDAVEGRG